MGIEGALVAPPAPNAIKVTIGERDGVKDGLWIGSSVGLRVGLMVRMVATSGLLVTGSGQESGERA